MRALARSRAVTSAATLNRRELVGSELNWRPNPGSSLGSSVVTPAELSCAAVLARPPPAAGRLIVAANCHPIGIRGHGDAILYTVGFAVENLIAADEPRRHEGEQICSREKLRARVRS